MVLEESVSRTLRLFTGEMYKENIFKIEIKSKESNLHFSFKPHLYKFEKNNPD